MRLDWMRAVDRTWPILRRLAAGHVAVYRASRGRIGHRFDGAPPMLLLEHVGAWSATRRTTPLVYVTDGDDVVIVASKGGHPRHPAWFHNLRANPAAEVQIGPERRSVLAHIATPGERERLWPKVVEAYAGYDDYQRRTEREIPLVVLEPR